MIYYVLSCFLHGLLLLLSVLTVNVDYSSQKCPNPEHSTFFSTTEPKTKSG